jgi:tRNA1Val (adenine37-N6)-methyltransferase
LPNTYFQFKQFIIHQDKCAIKVCTDSCVFGAWAASFIVDKSFKNILDIGTGTGLLSLMLAQQTTTAITAIEIDTFAFEQAVQNFAISNFNKQIQTLHANLLDFVPENKFDFIICNPPFFENDLQSQQKNKNAAKHETTLTLNALSKKASALLQPDGYFAVLLPYHRAAYFTEVCANQGLYCQQSVSVRQSTQHSNFRTMALYSFYKAYTVQQNIAIKDEEGNYTPEFTNLLKAYYLNL